MRRARMTATILVVVVTIVVGGFFYHNTHRPGAVPARLVKSQIAILEKGLNSRDRDEQASILAQPLRDGYVRANFTQAITIDRTSFTSDGMGAGRVSAYVAGSGSTKYVLTLVYAEDRWFIVSSVKQ